MKKIIRLTESDLLRMIKRMVKESKGNINETMSSDIVLINDEDINEDEIVKKEEFINKYGERIVMVEMNNGDVLIKHSDVGNKFMLFDSLLQKTGEHHYRLRIYFNEEERGYIASFFNGTNYESLIPGLSVR